MPPRIIQARTLARSVTNMRLCRGDFFSNDKHLLCVLCRQYDDTVGIPTQQISRLDADIADVDGSPNGHYLNAVFAGSHPVSAAVNRIAEFTAQGNVTIDAVDHGAGERTPMGDFGQDVAPHRGIFAPFVVQGDHAARRDIIDVIAHRARRHRGGAVEQRECAAGHLEIGATGEDTATLTRDGEPVQGVAQSGGVQSRGSLYLVDGGYGVHGFSMFS
jgi:hypothetical protein